MTWYDEIRPLVGRGFEVGWSYEGHPTPEEKVAALTEMLGRHGSDLDLWLVPPTIRYQHADTVEPNPFLRKLVPMKTCYWAVHGVLKKQPDQGYVPQGFRLPPYGERAYDA